MKEESVLLPLVYLPNVFWLTNYLQHSRVFIEQCENFSKGSFRNRCEIAGANGKQLLSIPLKGGRDHHQFYKDVEIDYSVPWQKIHWQSIKSAYGSAPFYEHYAHKLEPFYHKQIAHLFDFNVALLETILQSVKIQKQVTFTSKFEKTIEDKTDLRYTKPKTEAGFTTAQYLQPFQTKNGFQPNMSIIDLVFNLGPQTTHYLNNH